MKNKKFQWRKTSLVAFIAKPSTSKLDFTTGGAQIIKRSDRLSILVSYRLLPVQNMFSYPNKHVG
jgi:hypothetical protein